MRRECLRFFAENLHEFSIIAGIWIFPPSSVGTIFVIVPAPSPNVSSQFVLDMEGYEGIPRSPDVKQFASIGPSPAIQYSFRVLGSRQRSQEYTLRNIFLAVAAAAPCSPG